MSRDFWIPDESCSMCHECDSQFTVFHRRHHCRLCGRVFCSKCTAHSISVPSDKPKGDQEDTERVRVCNYCFRQRMHELVTVDHEAGNTSRLSLSPLQPAASLGTNSSTITAGSSSMAYSIGLYEHEMYDSSLSAERSSLAGHHSQDNGAIDQININTFMDAGNLSSNSNRSDDENGCGSYKGDLDEGLIDRREFEQLSQGNFSLEFLEGIKPSSNESGCQSDNDESLYEIESADLENLDFENNGLLWIPPEAEAQDDYREVDFFHEEDCDDTGEWGYPSSSSSLPGGDLSQREKYMEEHQKAMRNEVDVHIRALLTQLLEAENIAVSKVCDKETWLDIITRLSWEAASLLKPDMSKGSGMDPGEYVKVKCLACGRPSDSMVVKGVVCKKNVAHRRMVSKIDSPRLLMVGGALQYQRVSSHLSSFNTLLEQEMDHLKMAVAKIEAHRPDLLLVERTISRFAQEYLLAKNISLVLNVKRPLLERIARCTGAQIVPSIDHLESQKHGFCESFRVEKYLEEHGTAGLGGKKLTKTLMFFEGCPIPLGFTILLKGASGDELKKVKHVLRYGVFAAYHLALEASYLADEGASLLEIPLKSPIPIALPDKPLSVNQSIFTVPDLVIPNSEKSQGENNHLSSQLPSTVTTYVSSSECSQSSSSTNSKNPILKLVQFDNADSLSGQKYKEQNEKTRAPKEDLPSPISESQSILLSLTTRCVWKGVVCQRAHLLRIKYYRGFDKPLGRFLRDDLFDQSYRCRSCEMPSEAHIRCYTQQKGSLIISVRNLAEFLLPGERESKIWMWHRCLKCPRINGFPPATKRVAMSDATWGLSFGKLLDFSFSSHAAASRVASCGHSLHKDCLRFYGCGQMVACFRYAPINVHSIFLPPPKLEFTRDNQEWILKEANKVSNQGEILFIEVRNAINQISVESARSGALENSTCDLRKHVVELERILDEERVNFEDSLQKVLQTITKAWIDILDINKLRQRLLFQSYIWDQRLIYLSTLNASKLQHGFENFMPKAMGEHSKDEANIDTNVDSDSDETSKHMLYSGEKNSSEGSCEENDAGPVLSTRQFPVVGTSSDSFEAAWIGEGRSCEENDAIESSILFRWASSLTLPAEGFDNLDNSTNGLRVPFVNIYQPIMENTSWNTQQLGSVENYNPVFVCSFRELERRCNARLLLPAGVDDTVLPVYDDEPTSVISYALASPEYQIQVSDDSEMRKDGINSSVSFGSLQSFGSSEESPPVWDPLFYTKAFHAKVSFTDNGPLGMIKYNVICYYAKQFETLRDICCPSELDFIRSLSRCKKWGAQGGKSNVFFAKTLDDRFIIKQVTKTELESFIKFAPSYFKYTSESIISCSPTCLAKILGIYQVTTKHLKGGKESKIDVLVMENLLLKRNFTRLYDLKGSRRSRYNPDSSGVLLDQNLIETMSTSPIFVGNKAKRLLERAVWNDTSFLAAIDVMDYSLIVGVDEEKHELVVGIIDFMRQYTWDKHFETWVKASGFLGGPKNVSPTIISPDHYKKRFRKAMTTYFLMVPDQWSPPKIIPAEPLSDSNDDNLRNVTSP